MNATIKMLLVEDDEESGHALRNMLEKRKVCTDLVTEAEEALTRFGSGSYDLVVADIRLNGMSGVDLLRRIRKQDQDFPVILLTGFDSLDSAIQAVRLGAQDYILKPLDNIDDLVEPAKKAVENHRLLLRNRTLETERGQARDNLERTNSELRALSARLVESEETERRRLGRELHDQIGQGLTTVGISLSMIRKQLPPAAAEELVGRIDDALLQIEQLAEKIRHVMSELRPSVLDDYGLAAALKWYAGQFSMRTCVPVDLRLSEVSPRPSSVVETALFRIAQESLNNVAKHAHARKATISLENTDSGIRLGIADDGVGFDAQASRKRAAGSCWGLMSMRARAASVGATMEVRAEQGRGVLIVVETGKTSQ